MGKSSVGMVMVLLCGMAAGANKTKDYPLTLSVVAAARGSVYVGSYGSCNDAGCWSEPGYENRNRMLVDVAGQHFVISCTTDHYMWIPMNHCDSLHVGDYQAKKTKHGFEVLVPRDKGSPRAIKYEIVVESR